jgi:hypothetical protein
MVQSTIDATVNRALVTLSFFIAMSLVAAAIAYRLTLVYGVETALISLAAVFALVGTAVSAFNSSEAAAPDDTAEAPPSNGADTDKLLGVSGLSAADRELVLAFASAAAPIIAPRVVGMMLRNIPAMLVVALVVVLVARQAGSMSNGRENASMPVGGSET